MHIGITDLCPLYWKSTLVNNYLHLTNTVSHFKLHLAVRIWKASAKPVILLEGKSSYPSLLSCSCVYVHEAELLNYWVDFFENILAHRQRDSLSNETVFISWLLSTVKRVGFSGVKEKICFLWYINTHIDVHVYIYKE